MDEDSQAGTDRDWASLTDAERCVVPCVAAGMTDRSIAEKLYVAHHTVGAHLERLYHELDIHSRVELTALSMPHHG